MKPIKWKTVFGGVACKITEGGDTSTETGDLLKDQTGSCKERLDT
jgi:hypothetical protein